MNRLLAVVVFAALAVGCRDTTYGRAVQAQEEQERKAVQEEGRANPPGSIVHPPIDDATGGSGRVGEGRSQAADENQLGPQEPFGLPEDSNQQQPVDTIGKAPPDSSVGDTSNTGTGSEKSGTMRAKPKK